MADRTSADVHVRIADTHSQSAQVNAEYECEQKDEQAQAIAQI